VGGPKERPVEKEEAGDDKMRESEELRERVGETCGAAWGAVIVETVTTLGAGVSTLLTSVGRGRSFLFGGDQCTTQAAASAAFPAW